MSVFNKDYEDPHIFSYPPEFISSFSVLLVSFFRFLGGFFWKTEMVFNQRYEQSAHQEYLGSLRVHTSV